ISRLSQAELQEQLLNISEIETVVVTLLDAESLSVLNSAPVAAAAETVEAPKSQSPAVQDTKPEPADAGTQRKPAAAQAAPANVSRTIRVDIERLDSLMNLFSELLIDRVRLEQLASEVKRSDLTETVEHMARVSSDLQNIVLKLR